MIRSLSHSGLVGALLAASLGGWAVIGRDGNGRSGQCGGVHR